MTHSIHIAETALYVDDLDRAENFFSRLLECAVLRRDIRLRVLRVTDEQVLLLFLRGASIHSQRRCQAEPSRPTTAPARCTSASASLRQTSAPGKRNWQT
ncbi:MAG: hypothetical protein ACKV19_20925 [Verrucomicrobiales bacterium]